MVFAKTFLLIVTATTLALISVIKPYCQTYDASIDKLNHWGFLIPAAAIMAVIFHRDWTVIDYLWSFSIWLESVAILPQLYVRAKIRQGESIPVLFVTTLWGYRLFYFFNWMLKLYTGEPVYWISIAGGVIQIVMYGGFLVLFLRGKQQSKIENIAEEKPLTMEETIASESIYIPPDVVEIVEETIKKKTLAIEETVANEIKTDHMSLEPDSNKLLAEV